MTGASALVGAAFWYRGIPFQTLSEQDWARALDRLEVPWVFLQGQRPLPGSSVNPTFWLPASRQYLYVIGNVTVQLGAPVLARMTAFAAAHPPRPHTGIVRSVRDLRLIVGDELGRFVGFDGEGVHRSACYFRCRHCDGSWFADEALGWTCQVCGSGDGDHHLADQRPQHFRPWPDVEVLP